MQKTSGQRGVLDAQIQDKSLTFTASPIDTLASEVVFVHMR